MLQYLLNVTSIWLISLIVFDLLLSRVSYHAYNRFYLLFTLCAGIIIPLISWNDGAALYQNTSVRLPVEGIIVAKQSIVTSAGSSSSALSAEAYILYLYLFGAFVSGFLVTIEIVQLISVFRRGKKYREGSCIIIETGKDHSPYSLLRFIFVSGRANYSDEEWNMLVAHEQVHGLLLHFVDVILMQLTRIVFWFHPLVYVYQRKILLLHEYQADAATAADPVSYGRFLIDQALLGSAPRLTHTFNRSPIKNRIVMLTKKSTRKASWRMLTVLPVVLINIICFSQSSLSQPFKKDGNIVTYRGNKIELSKPRVDTIEVQDPVSGAVVTKVMTAEPQPIKLNGEKIFLENEVDGKPVYSSGKEQLDQYIVKSLQSISATLEDGDYFLLVNDIVINKKGEVAYYNNGGLMLVQKTNNAPASTKRSLIASPDVLKTIDKLMSNLSSFKPATENLKPVPFRMSELQPRKKIIVHDHKITVADI